MLSDSAEGATFLILTAWARNEHAIPYLMIIVALISAGCAH